MIPIHIPRYHPRKFLEVISLASPNIRPTGLWISSSQCRWPATGGAIEPWTWSNVWPNCRSRFLRDKDRTDRTYLSYLARSCLPSTNLDWWSVAVRVSFFLGSQIGLEPIPHHTTMSNLPVTQLYIWGCFPAKNLWTLNPCISMKSAIHCRVFCETCWKYPLVIQHSYWNRPFIESFPMEDGDFP